MKKDPRDRREYKKQYNLLNKEKIKSYKRTYTEKQREDSRIRSNIHYHRDIEYSRKRRKELMTEEKKEKNRIKSRTYYYENKEKVLEYRDKNKDIIKQKRKITDRLYSLNNREKCNAIKAKYKASKKQRVPPWITEKHLEEIEDFYKIARQMTIDTGIEYQVDHIVPIQGNNVSGLHLPWNLQILTKEENVRKRNYFIDKEIKL